MGENKKERRQRLAFDFLLQSSKSGSEFTKSEFAKACNWSAASVTSYWSKQFLAYLEPTSSGRFKAKPRFQKLSWDAFRELVTQVRHPVAEFVRSTFHEVLIYDFLLPLTREDKLRKALDALFYRDTLESAIVEAGIENLARSFPRLDAEGDDAYVARIIDFIGERIGGFSISHVSGRFRGESVLTRQESAELLIKDQAYLIDETTAVVRFILPCISSKVRHGSKFDLDAATSASDAIETEKLKMRSIFFAIFVEALVPTILGEQLIWLLETSAAGQRLYELKATSGNK